MPAPSYIVELVGIAGVGKTHVQGRLVAALTKRNLVCVPNRVCIADLLTRRQLVVLCNSLWLVLQSKPITESA